jgi:Ca2+-dependent lipid-binding protein
MWDRSYTITVVSATAAEGDPNGEYWDAAGGAPDLYVSIRIDDESIGVTSTQENTYSPEWYESVSARLYRTTSLVFRVFDEDLSENDHALELSVPDLGGAIRNGGGSYSTAEGLGVTSFEFMIEPR